MSQPAILTVAETLPKSFVLSCKTRGDKPAMREKLYGIWNAITWTQWLERSRAVTYALHSIGFRPGDVASVLANTVPEWNYADFGILCAGGVSSGIYPTNSAKQVEYLINDSKTKVLFVEDDEQLDKALEVRERCPTLRRSWCSTWKASPPSTTPWWCRSTSSWRPAATTARARKRCSTSWSPRASPATSPSSSTRRDDRAAQGRDAQPSQRRLHDAELHASRAVAVLVRGRRAAGLPAALPCRRAGRRQLLLRRDRRLQQLRREPRDGAGQYPRGAAHAVRRRAARLGEVLRRHHDRAEGRHAAAAMGLPEGDRPASPSPMRAGRREPTALEKLASRPPTGWC